MFKIGFEKTNKGVSEKELSCLPSNKKLRKLYRYLLCLTDLSPPPRYLGGKLYPMNASTLR